MNDALYLSMNVAPLSRLWRGQYFPIDHMKNMGLYNKSSKENLRTNGLL
jgi:hypothetical protein